MKFDDLATEYQQTNTRKITDFENMFDIYETMSGHYVYNLNSTMYIKSGENLPVLRVMHDSHWPLLSYQLYDTTRLAWFLMKLNDVKFEDAFKKVSAGTAIKYIDKDSLQQVINELNRR